MATLPTPMVVRQAGNPNDLLPTIWRQKAAYLCLLPTLLVIGVLIYIPMMQALELSFQEALKFIDPREYSFVGLANFITVALSPEFHHSLWLSVRFVLATVTLDTFLGLLAALTLSERFPLNNIARSLVLIAYVLPENVTGVFWKFLLSDNNTGAVNALLLGLGFVSEPISFFNRDNAFPTIILVQVWKDFAFSTVILLGALQQIAPDLYAMATIDGAGRWGRFRHITLPQLRNAIVLSLVLRTTYSLAEFTLPWQLTGGGPGSSTMLLPIYLWWQSFVDGNLGLGAVIGIYLLLLSAVSAGFYMWLIGRRGGAPA